MFKKDKVINPIDKRRSTEFRIGIRKSIRAGSYFTPCTVYFRSSRYITHGGFRVCLIRPYKTKSITLYV